MIAPGEMGIPEPRQDVSHPMAALFENLRRNRRRRRLAEPRTDARRAALTIVRDEPVFLPIWLRYYGRFFAPDDLYVLDHESSDGSTSGGGFVRIPVSHETVDHTWMVRTVEEHQHELLETYDAVVVTDVDEIVVPNPRLGDLGDYIDHVDEEFVNCFGYELIHLVDREPPFDPARRILDQRHYWFVNQIYSKPAITTKPMRWVPGFHHGEDLRMRLDPDLYMIHLHRMDYEICLARHRYRDERQWNERDVDLGWASHNRIVDEAEFARWFYREGDVSWWGTVDDPAELTREDLVVQPIPGSLRGIF